MNLSFFKKNADWFLGRISALRARNCDRLCQSVRCFPARKTSIEMHYYPYVRDKGVDPERIKQQFEIEMDSLFYEVLAMVWSHCNRWWGDTRKHTSHRWRIRRTRSTIPSTRNCEVNPELDRMINEEWITAVAQELEQQSIRKRIDTRIFSFENRTSKCFYEKRSTIRLIGRLACTRNMVCLMTSVIFKDSPINK